MRLLVLALLFLSLYECMCFSVVYVGACGPHVACCGLRLCAFMLVSVCPFCVSLRSLRSCGSVVRCCGFLLVSVSVLPYMCGPLHLILRVCVCVSMRFLVFLILRSCACVPCVAPFAFLVVSVHLCAASTGYYVSSRVYEFI